MRVFSLLAGQGLPVTSCSASRNNSPSDRVGHRHTDGDRLGLGAVDPISDRQQPPPRRADPVADAALVDVRLPAGWMASSGRGSKGALSGRRSQSERATRRSPSDRSMRGCDCGATRGSI